MYATRGLVEALLDLARESEPEAVTIALATTPAGEFASQLPPETPVFTHFYFPAAGRSLSAVFGMDLGTPAGQTQGRFVSHPQGKLALSRTDDLHGVVFVAVPPWGTDEIAVFSRDGIERSLELVDAEPPVESLD
jgi:proteasome lid subunit RPN8/RPN11